MRSRAMPGRFWDSTASKPITGMTLLLAIAPPNGMADLRDKKELLLSRLSALCFMVLTEHDPRYHMAQPPSRKGGNFQIIHDIQSGQL